MRLKLILKKIISDVITRNLTKTDATELLISLLEKSENANVLMQILPNLGLRILTMRYLMLSWISKRIFSDKNKDICNMET